MPDTGFRAPLVGENVGVSGVSWSSPEQIKTDDAAYADVGLNSFESSKNLVARSWNSLSSLIPAGSTIDGMECSIVDHSISVGAGGSWQSLTIQDELGIAGIVDNDSQLTALTTTPTTSNAGGATELWGDTPTRANVIDVDYGYRVVVQTNVSTCNIQIDQILNKVYYTSESVTATGTITGADEQDILDGGILIYLDLTGVTWATAGATFDAQRQGIIDGIDSAQTETLGWNNEVRDTMTVARCVRTSDTRVTITLNARECADYKITADEVLTATIPASAHSGSTILTNADFATVTALCDQTLAPTVLDTQTNLTGAVTDIDESVDSPDSNWLVLA